MLQSPCSACNSRPHTPHTFVRPTLHRTKSIQQKSLTETHTYEHPPPAAIPSSLRAPCSLRAGRFARSAGASLVALLTATAARTHAFVAPAPYPRFCARPPPFCAIQARARGVAAARPCARIQMASGEVDVVVVGSCNYDQFVYVAEFPGRGETIYGLQILKSHYRTFSKLPSVDSQNIHFIV